MKRILSLWVPVVLWAALIFTFSSFSHIGPEVKTVWDFLLRKLAHVLEYAVLAFLSARAFEGDGRKAVLLSILYAVSDELHQALVPLREARVLDVFIDAAGSFPGAWIWSRLARRMPKKFRP